MKEFSCTNCGMCCGPVPITKKEYKRIKKKVRSLPKRTRDELKRQPRGAMTCIFLNTETKRCGIYHDRPDICKMYGFYEGLQCPNNRETKLLPDYQGRQRVLDNQNKSELVGILSIDITWEDFK